MRNWILLLLVFLGSACRRCEPLPLKELSSKYYASPEAFEHFKQMIRADTGKRDCFAVGKDNIGEYWEIDGKWTKSSEYKRELSLSEVLGAVGLSETRYKEYLKLFETTGSERVSSCRSGNPWPQVEVLVFRCGLSIGGCVSTINWHEKGPLPKEARGHGELREVQVLDNNWYAESECR